MLSFLLLVLMAISYNGDGSCNAIARSTIQQILPIPINIAALKSASNHATVALVATNCPLALRAKKRLAQIHFHKTLPNQIMEVD